jgi:hypothetical protein
LVWSSGSISFSVDNLQHADLLGRASPFRLRFDSFYLSCKAPVSVFRILLRLRSARDVRFQTKIPSAAQTTAAIVASMGLRPYTLEKAKQFGFDQPYLEACL